MTKLRSIVVDETPVPEVVQTEQPPAFPSVDEYLKAEDNDT